MTDRSRVKTKVTLDADGRYILTILSQGATTEFLPTTADLEHIRSQIDGALLARQAMEPVREVLADLRSQLNALTKEAAQSGPYDATNL
jgi:hypothetical protein